MFEFEFSIKYRRKPRPRQVPPRPPVAWPQLVVDTAAVLAVVLQWVAMHHGG